MGVRNGVRPLVVRRNNVLSTCVGKAERARATLDADGLARATAFADSLYRPELPRADDVASSAAMQRTFMPTPKPEDCAAPSP